MTPRYAVVRPDWALRGWPDAPRCAVNRATGDLYRLGHHAFCIARACDGRTDLNSPVFSARHRALLDRLLAAGLVEDCRPGTVLRADQRYRWSAAPRIAGLQWAVTGRCNLNCRHCYMSAPVDRYGELPSRQAADIIDQLAEANVEAVSLTGGEPFLRADLMQLIERLVTCGIRVTDIYSNGTLIHDRTVRDLTALGVRPIFRISFDGCGTHDYMRGTSGVEPLVIDTIRRLTSAGYQVAVATCVDTTNVGRLVDTYELMRELDLYAWGVGRPQPLGCWRTSTSQLGLDEMAHVCEDLLRRWLHDGRPFMIGLEAFYSGAGAGADGSSPPACEQGAAPREQGAAPREQGAAPREQSVFACSSCREWPYLAADGTLLPCIGYEGTALVSGLPNVVDQGFAAALGDPALRALLDLPRSEVLSRNPQCSACEALSECGTGCRSAALAATGELLGRDTGTCALVRGGHKRRFAELAACGG
ncbi:MAG: radical SAM protein [Micromonosporaceae bacterium]|nr:radical SAM protein [Micromonosporaceae bacterium]